ncbi:MULTISPECIES: hypothetical protein [Streptomyces]|uniref:hypothetical protein n=1 Tax=Streptomyces TaxID=1883 RepID=UPI0004CB51D9|nr:MULTISPECIES: hypothetical protein [Streptomyces]KOT62737.1 hypothetical protein ADK43_09725 [Streptomyces rimosus subsp. rimosus]
MNLDLVRDWAVAAIAVRVFSADIRMLLRRLAAAQVLAGVSELTRTGTGTRTGAGTRERLRTGTRTRTRAAAPAHQARDYDTPYGGSPYNAPYGGPSYGPQRDHDLQEGER